MSEQLFEPDKYYVLEEEDWDKLYPSPYNIRKTDIEGQLIEWEPFIGSIRKNGIEKPLDVDPSGGIFDGQRRFAAIRIIVLEEKEQYADRPDERPRRTIPFICRDFDPREQTKWSINSNTHRKDITAHDLAKSIGFLVEEMGSQRAVAKYLGQSDSWVSECLTVLSTPERKWNKKDKKVVQETKPDSISVDDLPSSKRGGATRLGKFISSTGESKDLQRVVEDASSLPRDQRKELVEEVETIKKEEGEVTPEVVEEKIKEKQAIKKTTVMRSFRLENTTNDYLKTAEAQGVISNQHVWVNLQIQKGLEELGVMGEQ